MLLPRRFPLPFALLLPVLPLPAQEGYRMPDPALVELVDAPLTPALSLSPDRTRVLLLERAPVPTIADLAAPEVRLAGLRFNPDTLASNRDTHFTRLVVKTIADGAETPITGFPAGAKITQVSWSPDGRHLAAVLFTGERPGELWVAEVATARARALTGPVLHAVLGDPVDWLDAGTLLATVVPPDRGPPPARDVTAIQPIVQENTGRAAPARTYQDLLASPADEAEFEYHATTELVRVILDGTRQSLGLRGLLSVTPSPDGRHLLLRSIIRPYSYTVPLSRFPVRLSVHAADGRLLRELGTLPLADNIPIAAGSTRPGPRSVGWRADAPATLAWFEARDGGDGARAAEVRDELLMLPAPFTGDPVSVLTLGLRASGLAWGDATRALVTESWTRARRTRTWLFDPSRPGTPPTLVFDRSSEDRYVNPGEPVLTPGPFGRAVLQFTPDGRGLFLSGLGASPEGNQPFLDRFTLADRTATRLWRSRGEMYENLVALLDPAGARILTVRESPETPPNYFVRDLAAGTERAFTAFPHPYPRFAGVRKELIRYPRADGVQLTGNLYLPPGWDPSQGPLPTLLWAYPREFRSADAASQVRDSPHRFVRISPSGPLPFLLLGYAVLDDPAMPIIGQGDQKPNDTYVTQLVASARAAIDELVRRGVTDPDRVAVGGHSYGAFMTANLLAHSDLFRAGIARSGAYNRTLTPFGFQAEDRTFWQAPGVYAAMSPFHHADQVRDALLLIHGQLDNNSGTFPIQSERFYQALKGHGATTRYVQLPYESHGYRARESLLHVLWETSQWLDTFVKQPATRDRR